MVIKTLDLDPVLDPDRDRFSANPNKNTFNCSFIPCLMIRNTLGRWRLAAVELYNFPLELPVTLHICPEEERDKWIAEIDLDPAYKVNLQILTVLRIWIRDPVTF